MSITGIPPTWSIAEAAATTGLSPSTLRYYERDGLLLDTVERSASGHRRYSDADLAWLVLINRLRATGMSIREVREFAVLVRAGSGTEAARLDMLGRHRARVLAQLAEVQEHLAALDSKISHYAALVAQGAPLPEAGLVPSA